MYIIAALNVAVNPDDSRTPAVDSWGCSCRTATALNIHRTHDRDCYRLSALMGLVAFHHKVRTRTLLDTLPRLKTDQGRLLAQRTLLMTALWTEDQGDF